MGATLAETGETISIHAPRTGSDDLLNLFLRAVNISIHAPRTGSDRLLNCYIAQLDISIHAPRTGSDMLGQAAFMSTSHFNPRSPHGERL